ncbi:J domain-containing protein [Wielerella bovis]|uniref:J domain-containing protein n=1 Tax=Wielerella bovis TaxID=2917790 RepID=UPI0020197551|nr:J domain-containing protein [Wielerella bovis]ULJ68445.1 J domain-containing protein [Wielerella bovis]
MRTHYDNLHISRDSDAETIRSAYRRLSKQYHPDYNPSPDAHRIMQIINRAYDVLSDPQRRAEHDRWIAEQERIEAETEYQLVIKARENTSAMMSDLKGNSVLKRRAILMGMVSFCAVLTALLCWQVVNAFHQRQDVTSVPNTTVANHAQMQPEMMGALANGTSMSIGHQQMIASTTMTPTVYVRPTAAPNGMPFPQNTGYIDGYEQVRGINGTSRVIVENIRNTSDVFAELYTIDNPQILRTFFIKERSQIVLDNLDFGTYAVRYRQLDDGEELHSENVILSGAAREATIYLQKGRAPTVVY